MLFHILQLPTIGPLAVYSFFILSGFLMTTILHNSYGYTLSGFKKYAINRFLRLYPTYWFLLLLIIFIIFLVGAEFAKESHSKMQMPTTITEWTANIGMLFIQFNPVEYSPRLAPPTWALTIELFFYTLIGLGVSKTKKITWIWFAASASYIVLTNLITGKLGTGYGNIFNASLPFSIGSLLFFYRIKLLALIKKTPHCGKILTSIFLFNVCLTSVISAFSFEFFQQHGWKVEIISTWLNLPLSALMTVLLFSIRPHSKRLKELDLKLGDYSYPLYIFHTGAACLASWIFVQIGLLSKEEYILPIFILALIISLCACQLSESLVNNKINKLRNKIKAGTNVN